jgi:hypothetical protein
MNIFIEGNKDAFNSKSAILKFKNEIKKNINFDIKDLEIKYINYNYKLELIENNNNNIKFNIIFKNNNNDIRNNKLIKNKINNMKNLRNNEYDINTLYNKLKSKNLSIPLPSPQDVKNEPEKYKYIIENIFKLLNKKKINNDYLKYFKLLNEEIENNNLNNNNNNNENNNENNNNEISENSEFQVLFKPTINNNIIGNNIEDVDTDTED